MSLIHVEFDWDDALGTCADCGLPAAYCVPDRYGEGKPLTDDMLVCAVCAASEAATGERIIYLWHEDSINGTMTPEVFAIVNHYNPVD